MTRPIRPAPALDRVKTALEVAEAAVADLRAAYDALLASEPEADLPDDLVPVKTFAKELGVSYESSRRWALEYGLAYRIGGRIYVSRAEFTARVAKKSA